MAERIVTVLGGTGFLGRRIVRHMRAHDFSVRVATRHPERSRQLFGEDARISAVAADVHDAASVAQACAGAYGVVNAVSLYVEQGSDTFWSVHVKAAERVAEEARRAGASRLVHVSGIGVEQQTRSPYIRTRARGERAVRRAFADALIVRPSVMFGPDDGFLTMLVDLVRRLPVIPLFGRGQVRLQPAYVEDVGEAIARSLAAPVQERNLVECAGPEVYEYARLLETIAREMGVRPVLLPMPFPVWHGLAFVAEHLPNAPISRNQVELMEIDNVASPDAPGLTDLGIVPTQLTAVLQTMLGRADH